MKKDKDQMFPERKPMQIGYMLWQPHRFCGIESEVEGRFTVPTIYRSNHLSSYGRVEDELSLRAERLDHYGPSAQVVGRLTRSGSD